MSRTRTAAASAVLLLGLLPQAAPAQTMAEPPAATARGEQQEPMTLNEYLDRFDRSVSTADGNEVGEVTDLMFENNRVVAVVVETEAQLGLGSRRIAIPIERLQMQDDRIVVEMTREELQGLPSLPPRE